MPKQTAKEAKWEEFLLWSECMDPFRSKHYHIDRADRMTETWAMEQDALASEATLDLLLSPVEMDPRAFGGEAL